MEISISTNTGEIVTLPAIQAMAVARCVDTIRAGELKPVWHKMRCGCCVAVHDDPMTCGFVVGNDGSFDWYPILDNGDQYEEHHES